VEAALVSDVPVGVFLPGGLDSSSVAAIARRVVGPDLETFTVAFDVPGFDERDYAALVSRALGTRHHVVTVTPDVFLEGLRELAPLIDEPLADQSLVPTFLLARYAVPRQGRARRRGERRAVRRLPDVRRGLLAARYRRFRTRCGARSAASRRTSARRRATRRSAI
jgi:hypothetical protein